MSVLPPLPADDLDHVLREGADLWPGLGGARIFITGATGFFGRWMLESLLAANRRFHLGTQVVALSRDPGEFLSGAPHLAEQAGLRWVQGSVDRLATASVTGEKFDLVIHLATEADTAATLGDPGAAVEVIAGGTRRVLEFAGQVGARRFLFTSSGSIYGAQPPGIDGLPETFEAVPAVAQQEPAYVISGEAKRQAEQYCQDALRRHGLEVVIARGFSFAGPALPLDAKFAFGNFLRDALAGRPILIKGDGTPVRSYLYAADLAVWLWTLLLRGAPGRSFNVGSEHAITLGALADLMSLELGSPGVDVRQTPPAGHPPHRYVPSTRRAREELGLRQTVGLEETIRRTAAWHRSVGKS